MSWVRLDAAYFSHPRVILAGHYGWQVHLAAVVLCKQFGWGGTIPRDSLTVAVIARTLNAPAERNVTKRYTEGLASCLSAGLLEDTGTHYRIRDWDQYQRDPSNAERQARHRAAKESNGTDRAVTQNGVSNGIQDVTGRDVTGRDKLPPTPNGGGASTSSPNEEPQGQEPLAQSDRLAFEAIYKGIVGAWTTANPATVRCRALRSTLLTPTPDCDGIREFVTKHTPSFLDEVQNARRTAAMEANGRRKRGVR